MARRDILARYRGSFGDVFWTVLNPLLLMSTYFFVFGIVLQSRFPGDQSRTGFALYFLAGMLPWLAFSEPVGRAASVILEHRNFVKKLVFPLDTLPVNQVVSGLVTELFGAGVFVAGLLIIRHTVPAAVLWLPVLLVPQLMFTLGVCWFLAALGVYMRDLGQIMALVLTLWFFITPICYPESHQPVARDLSGDATESFVHFGARISCRFSRRTRAGVPSVNETVGYRAGAILLGARLVLPAAQEFRRRDLIYSMHHYEWDKVEKEQLNPSLARQVIHGETMTVARMYLAKGCKVPEHSHHNEQISIMEQGSAKFILEGVERVMKPGELVRIPPNVPHSVEALEDCVALDLFSPRREDWLRGDDAYLRK